MIPPPDITVAAREPAVEVYLLGQVSFELALALQQRLVYETSGRQDGQVTLVVCEHPPTITMGRAASRAHLRVDPRELASRKLDVRWVNRGGGCLLHTPGQLAVYSIVPLEQHGWSVGEYLERLESGLAAALKEIGCHAARRPGRRGLWGRSGQLAWIGVAVKNWVTYYGAYLNVSPEATLLRGLVTDSVDFTRPGALLAEKQQAVKMGQVREAVARHLADSFGMPRRHVYTSHPFLRPLAQLLWGNTARVG